MIRFTLWASLLSTIQTVICLQSLPGCKPRGTNCGLGNLRENDGGGGGPREERLSDVESVLFIPNHPVPLFCTCRYGNRLGRVHAGSRGIPQWHVRLHGAQGRHWAARVSDYRAVNHDVCRVCPGVCSTRSTVFVVLCACMTWRGSPELRRTLSGSRVPWARWRSAVVFCDLSSSQIY